MRAILITGAAGFIGSHLCDKYLALGHRVIGVDNFDDFYSRSIKEDNLRSAQMSHNFQFYEMDVLNINKIEIEGEIDTVIHLAAKAGVLPSIKSPEDYIETNVLGNLKVLEFINNRSIKKYVFASSSSVYGNCDTIPFNENEVVSTPISPYASSKTSAESLNYVYHHLYGIDVINLRFFTVYGPRQRPDLAIHKFIKNIYLGRPIHVYGDGSTSRDYTFIDDIVTGVMSAVEYVGQKADVCEVINIGSGSPISLKDLIEALFTVTGKETELIYEEEKPGDVKTTYADISKAKLLLDYQPSTNAIEGLNKFNTWFLEHAKDSIRLI
jgi:nucleoside-diphosphate-sugar epimerase